MSSLSRIRYSSAGDPTAGLREALAQNVDSYITQAFSQWCHPRQQCRDEDSHTVRFKVLMDDIARSQPRFAYFTVTFNEPLITEEILSGATLPKSALKPDLRVKCFHDDVAHIEAKIVARGRLAREYLVNGMQRFADGRYGAGHQAGYMLGYIHDTELADAVAMIDAVIAARDDSGWTTLSTLSGDNGRLICGSDIPREDKSPIRLFHLLCRCTDPEL